MSFYRKSYRPRRGGEEPEKCADPAKARARALDALSAREMTSTQLYERLCARFTEQAAAAEEGVKKIRSCCRGCGKMECGVWVYVQDGKVIRSEGDEAAFQSMGNHCSKGQASLQAAYHPDRLKYPMKRTNPKDSDDPGWQRITWDEAMSTIAEKLQGCQVKIAAKGGNEGKLFGAVTSAAIADALKAQYDMDVDSKKLVIDEPIKSFGSYQVKAKLGYEISGIVNVLVIEEK